MGQNDPYRSSSDNDDNNTHPHMRAAGQSSGNARAGRSGGEDTGSKKKDRRRTLWQPQSR